MLKVITGRPRIAPDSIRLDSQLGGWWLFKGISSRAISCSSYVPHGGCQSNCMGSRWGWRGGSGYFWPLPYLSLRFWSVNISWVSPVCSNVPCDFGGQSCVYWLLIDWSECDQLGGDGCWLHRESEKLFTSNQLTALKKTQLSWGGVQRPRTIK